MKKRWMSFVSLLLCALLLCACAQKPAPVPTETPLPVTAHGYAQETAEPTPEPTPEPAPEPTPEPTEEPTAETEAPQTHDEELRHEIPTAGRSEDMPSFGEMVYERPDLDELDALIALAEEAMNGGADYETVEPLLDDCFLYYYHFDTMYTLADIRTCLDQTDEYYADEYLWCSENYTLVDQAMDGLYYACAASPLGQELEEKYFWDGFCEEYADESESDYNETTVALMQEESNIIAEYRALSADPVVTYNGEEAPLSELLESLSGMSYLNALLAYYDQYNEQFADVFIRLVAVREKLAAELGYENYEQMAYERTYGREYTPEQAETYLQDIRTWMVPLYMDLSASDVYYETSAGKALKEVRLREILGTAVKEFGGDVEEAYGFMTRHELCDVRADSRKAGMSFETYINDYEVPFLLIDAKGTEEDILTFAHEFGHFTDGFVNENAYETIDLAEFYSQGMEYLVLSRLDKQLSAEEVDNIAKAKMIETVEMYIQQASFAEFEHRIYALGSENLSAETLNETARQLSKDYGYYNAYLDSVYAMLWMDIPHFYEQAFYVVSYPVSNDLAMQVYEIELAEEGAGLQRYLDNIRRDFSDMMGLVEAGGFESPFAPGRIEKVAATARAILGL